MDNPQADLLEKLALIREAVERNPDAWWRELHLPGHEPFRNARALFRCMSSGGIISIRLKPQHVKVEGWVDQAVTNRLKSHMSLHPGPSAFYDDIEALLQLVKEKGDGM